MIDRAGVDVGILALAQVDVADALDRRNRRVVARQVCLGR